MPAYDLMPRWLAPNAVVVARLLSRMLEWRRTRVLTHDANLLTR